MVVVIILVVVILLLVISCVKVVPQAHAMVIERLGAYLTTWPVDSTSRCRLLIVWHAMST